MNRLVVLLSLCAVTYGVQGSPRQPSPPKPFPVGKFHVEFANGVNETCDIERDGSASVVEARRNSRGSMQVKDESFLLSFGDDRLERWTPVGNRFVVEHWFPGSRRSTVTPVLGIAERVKDVR